MPSKSEKPGIQQGPEHQERNYEILHGTLCDVVIRTDIPDSVKVKQLAIEFLNEFPSRWISNPDTRAFDTWIDNFENPKYLIKKRGQIGKIINKRGKIKSRIPLQPGEYFI